MTTSFSINVSLKQAVRFLWHFYRRHKRLIILSYAFISFSTIFSLSNPYLYAWLVDTISNEFASGNRDFVTLMYPILGIVFSSVFFHITTRCSYFLNTHIVSRSVGDIYADMTSRVHRFETDWHANMFLGSMVTAIRRGAASARTLYDEMCYEFWPAVIFTIMTIILMMNKSVIIGVFFIFFAISLVSVSIFVSRRFVIPHNRSFNEEDSRLGGFIADSLGGNAIVRAFGTENREYVRVKNVTQIWQKLAGKSWFRSNVLTLVQNCVINLGRLVALTLAAWLWSQGKFTPGDVMYVLMSQRVLGDYLDGIGNNLNRVITSLNDMEEVVHWSVRRPKIESKPNAKHVTIKDGAIEFNAVNFFYNDESKLALTDFNLNIKAGEKIALVGPSGGGKTTVLKLLQRFYEAQQGSINLDGHNITDLDLSSMRSAMALVPQEPILFHRSLADNIAYAAPDSTIEEIKRAAEAAQIASLIEGLPLGYDTLVGERGIKLSGGERQRVAIARAILANAPILLLDEATSALDSEAEEEIQKAIGEASKNRTMIAIAHRLSTIQSADRIIVLSQGRIVEQGSHNELLALPLGLYRRLYEAQAKGFLPDNL